MRAALILGLPHLWYFGIKRPLDAWRSRHALRQSAAVLPARVPYFRSMVIQLVTLTMVSLSTLFLLWSMSPARISPEHLFVLNQSADSARGVWSGMFPAEFPDASAWLLGGIAYLLMIGIDLPFSRRCIQRGEPHSHLSMPQNSNERLWWIALSLAAGVGEEITWRGVQPELVAQLAGSLWPTVGLCAATFGLGHIVQGWRWAVVTAVFGVALSILVLLTGSLYVAIAVHVAVNVTIGLYSGFFGRKVGYEPVPDRVVAMQTGV